jgi:nucleotide-binding universal stress UspA family protein
MLVHASPSQLGRWDKGFSPLRVVLTLDGKELAERALEPALRCAEMFGAALALFRVAKPVAPAQAYLDRIAERCRTRGLVVTSDVVFGDHPAQAIIDFAAGDPVIMATHSHGLPRRSLVGSVTDKVVRGTRGPVVAIPAGYSETDRAQEPRRDSELTPQGVLPLKAASPS